ncbi:MAG: nucleotide exchange factor GrpE, partial [Alphaproteobacteria bacterium]
MKNDWKTKYLYVLAEIENLKKQQAKEKIKNVERAEEKILFELLEIIDNFKRADYCERFSEGIALIYQQFKNVLESYGVSSFVSLNKPFDPDF